MLAYQEDPLGRAFLIAFLITFAAFVSSFYRLTAFSCNISNVIHYKIWYSSSPTNKSLQKIIFQEGFKKVYHKHNNPLLPEK